MRDSPCRGGKVKRYFHPVSLSLVITILRGSVHPCIYNHFDVRRSDNDGSLATNAIYLNKDAR
jgi:hypothetical protein